MAAEVLNDGCSESDDGIVPLYPRVMQRRKSSDLFEFISTGVLFKEKDIQFIFKQVVDAVAYLHNEGYVHRDIKDENIIVDEVLRVKLIDFGASRRIPSSKSDYIQRFSGTLLYTPPELLVDSVHRGPEADMWCLGVVLYKLAYSTLPFAALDHISENLRKPPTCSRSPELVELIDTLLDPNPITRASISQVGKHRWIECSY